MIDDDLDGGGGGGDGDGEGKVRRQGRWGRVGLWISRWFGDIVGTRIRRGLEGGFEMFGRILGRFFLFMRYEAYNGRNVVRGIWTSILFLLPPPPQTQCFPIEGLAVRQRARRAPCWKSALTVVIRVC